MNDRPWWQTAQGMIAVMFAATACIVILGIVVVLMFGLFDARVENDKIFGILDKPVTMLFGLIAAVLGAVFLKQAK